MKQNVILDRAVEQPWLDFALSLDENAPADERRKLLDVFLRDRVESANARVKVVRIIARTWITPPDPARGMIEWAIDRSGKVSDSRTLHIGSLIACYPFFGQTCSAIGKDLALHKEVLTTDLRERLKGKWGSREVIDVTSRAAIRTLRGLGVLRGRKGDSRSELGEKIAPDPFLKPWLLHALMISRELDEMDEGEALHASELFMFDLGSPSKSRYPFLERFNEGGGRTVLRASPSKPKKLPSAPSQISLANEFTWQ